MMNHGVLPAVVSTQFWKKLNTTQVLNDLSPVPKVEFLNFDQNYLILLNFDFKKIENF